MSRWRPFWSYVAWQAPSWLVAVLVAIVLHRALGLGAWLVISVLVLYVGEPLHRSSPRGRAGVTSMPGILIGRAVSVRDAWLSARPVVSMPEYVYAR